MHVHKEKEKENAEDMEIFFILGQKTRVQRKQVFIKLIKRRQYFYKYSFRLCIYALFNL